jgi:transcriptional regulator with GAF, ATPase, and Fis domain
MASRVVWRQCLLAERAAVPATILDALASVGVRTYQPEPDSSSGSGIVFFDRLAPDLFDLVRAASCGGIERVLAVALGDATLTVDAAWRLLLAGASDVIVWDQHEQPAAEIAARFERWAEVDRLVESPVVRDNLIGKSPAWIAVLRHLVDVARFTDASVLILGETGTGKELAARLIHTLDRRPRKAGLVVLDCATVVPELSGSEFFGHERGAFTGAVAARDGCFALADGGTLFLDEIGELPLPLQGELLRAIQEHTFKRVGSNVWRESHFRLVCASNRELLDEVAHSAFRRDLYYRIASVMIRLPSLRDRSSDIIPLARHFFTELQPDRDPPAFDEPVREYLVTRPYPGNIRDLRQLVHRIAARHVGPGPITVGDIPPEERPAPDGATVDWRDAAFENAIRRAVARGVALRDIGHAATEVAIDIAVTAEGSLQRAARQLGVTDRALQLRRAAKRVKPALGSPITPDAPEWSEGPQLPS